MVIYICYFVLYSCGVLVFHEMGCTYKGRNSSEVLRYITVSHFFPGDVLDINIYMSFYT